MMAAAKDSQIIGKGRKVLLFDIKKETSKMTRFELVSYINALVHWNQARIDYLNQVDEGEIDGHYALQCC